MIEPFPEEDAIHVLSFDACQVLADRLQSIEDRIVLIQAIIARCEPMLSEAERRFQPFKWRNR